MGIFRVRVDVHNICIDCSYNLVLSYLNWIADRKKKKKDTLGSILMPGNLIRFLLWGAINLRIVKGPEDH